MISEFLKQESKSLEFVIMVVKEINFIVLGF